ncbi:MAG: chromate efflux transporter [Hyphomicrobiales bacterium]
MTSHEPSAERRTSPAEVFRAFLGLGLTSFGGPVAHLGYFREAFVVRRGWIDDRAYADLVALCQFLPGPASRQVGMAIGLAKAGLPGALAAWCGFTLPSALAMIVVGYGIVAYGAIVPPGVLHGLKVVAVAVVAQAVLGMARSLTPDAPRLVMALAAALAVLAVPAAWMQIAVIAAGGLVGLALLKARTTDAPVSLGVAVPKPLAIASLAAFAILLVGLPLLAGWSTSQALKVADAFYRAGSLVFGGGHVVLPLLQQELVPRGWVSNDAFLAGYGAAQAVPGPLFTFAAYLGTVLASEPNGWRGGFLALVSIFLPSLLLVVGALPFWEELRHNGAARRAMQGVNAAVVGLLAAALVTPVGQSAILSPIDLLLAGAAYALVTMARVPPWAVVLMTALAGWGLGGK